MARLEARLKSMLARLALRRWATFSSPFLTLSKIFERHSSVGLTGNVAAV